MPGLCQRLGALLSPELVCAAALLDSLHADEGGFTALASWYFIRSGCVAEMFDFKRAAWTRW